MQHLPVPPAMQRNIEYKFYESGHMVYAKDDALKSLHDNAAAFIRRNSAAAFAAATSRKPAMAP
jgi:carboxypeptidase C (cathepsin A)